MRYAHLEQASLVAVAETVSIFLAQSGRENTGEHKDGNFIPRPHGAYKRNRASPTTR